MNISSLLLSSGALFLGVAVPVLVDDIVLFACGQWPSQNVFTLRETKGFANEIGDSSLYSGLVTVQSV
jgi:hypothetical protein